MRAVRSTPWFNGYFIAWLQWLSGHHIWKRTTSTNYLFGMVKEYACKYIYINTWHSSLLSSSYGVCIWATMHATIYVNICEWTLGLDLYNNHYITTITLKASCRPCIVFTNNIHGVYLLCRCRFNCHGRYYEPSQVKFHYHHRLLWRFLCYPRPTPRPETIPLCRGSGTVGATFCRRSMLLE